MSETPAYGTREGSLFAQVTGIAYVATMLLAEVVLGYDLFGLEGAICAAVSGVAGIIFTLVTRS